MKTLIAFLLLCSTTAAHEITYQGTWVTTRNRKLNGTMTCNAKDLGKENWEGRFHGVWQGVVFSYTVKWTGPPDKLVGKASIDGADYTWTGKITPETPGVFTGTFDSGRYTGSFDLKEK